MSRNFMQHPELFPWAGRFPALTGRTQEPDYFWVAVDAIREAGRKALEGREVDDSDLWNHDIDREEKLFEEGY